MLSCEIPYIILEENVSTNLDKIIPFIIWDTAICLWIRLMLQGLYPNNSGGCWNCAPA